MSFVAYTRGEVLDMLARTITESYEPPYGLVRRVTMHGRVDGKVIESEYAVTVQEERHAAFTGSDAIERKAQHTRSVIAVAMLDALEGKTP